MSFYEEQEEDWFANDCKGAPSDYYAGELAPWLDKFTDTSKPSKPVGTAQTPRTRSRSKKRREQRKRADLRKLANP